MLHFSVKEKKDEVDTIREGDVEYELARYEVEPSFDTGDSTAPTGPMLLCSCMDMKRGKLCRHFSQIVKVMPFVDLLGASPLAHVQLYGSGETWPGLAARVWGIPNGAAIDLTVGSHSPEGTFELNPIGMVMGSETVLGVRKSVIEWLSSLPYTYPHLACQAEFHPAGKSPHENKDKHFDAATGTFDRLFLSDLYMVFTTHKCISCHLAEVPFDFDDNERVW